MTFSAGDRIRYECIGDDGLPLVRYGFIGGVAGSAGPVVVMLDGELGGDVVNVAQVQPVTILTVELVLHGTDLLDDAGDLVTGDERVVGRAPLRARRVHVAVADAGVLDRDQDVGRSEVASLDRGRLEGGAGCGCGRGASTRVSSSARVWPAAKKSSTPCFLPFSPYGR